jgi:hypothetical protein
LKNIRILSITFLLVFTSLLIYFKGCGNNVPSFSNFFNSNEEGNSGYKLVIAGVNTFRLNFTNEIDPREGLYKNGSGLIVKSGSYSPGFNFRVREHCKDSFNLIFTQTLISKLSNENMDVIYVVSLEEPGEKRDKWFGCYAVNDNFKKNQWTILNGKHKLEDYKITDSTYLKGYIWNKGKGDLAISFLDLMFENPNKIAGKKTEITHLKNGPIYVQKEFLPYKEKTIVNVEKIKTIETKENFECINYHDNSIYLGSRKNILSLNLRTLVSTPINMNLPPSNLAISSKNLLSIPTYAKSSIKVKKYSFNNGTKDTIIKIKQAENIVISENNHNSEHAFITMTIDGKEVTNYSFDLSSKAQNMSNSKLLDGNKIVDLKEISSKMYQVITKTGTESKLWLFDNSSTSPSFNQIIYESEMEKNLLDIDENTSIFPFKNNEFIVLSTTKRNALYRVEISSINKIKIKESYHLRDIDNKTSPFYFENLIITSGMYRSKSGFYLYGCNDQNKSSNELTNVNQILYFFEIL